MVEASQPAGRLESINIGAKLSQSSPDWLGGEEEESVHA